MAAKKKKAPAKTADNSDRKPFKEYFDRAAANALADQIAKASKSFDKKKFVRLATAGLGDLEFNARVGQFAAAMAETLPDSPPKAMAILKKSLPPPLPNCPHGRADPTIFSGVCDQAVC